MDIIGILLLVVSLIVLGFSGYWFYLALFDKPRFSRLMEEQTRPRIPERIQYASALILFPVMLVGVILLLVSLLTP